MQPTVVLGSGGHAKVVVEILREASIFEPIGCVAPQPPDDDHIAGAPYLGTDDDLPHIRESGVRWAFVAVGDNLLRDALLQQAIEIGFQLASAVSRRASISPSAHLGRGLAIMPGAVIGPACHLEDGCVLNTNAAVDHDGYIGHCAHIGPGTTLAGNVSVGRASFVATGSSVIPDISIGINSIVGAGSVVIRDIPDDVVAYGVPARVQRERNLANPQNEVADGQDDPPTFRLVS